MLINCNEDDPYVRIAKLESAQSSTLQTVCEWAITNGFATGHADTIEQCLDEIAAQIAERLRRHREDVEQRDRKIVELRADITRANEAGEVLHAKYRELEAEIAKLAQEIGRLRIDNARLRDCWRGYDLS